MKELHITLPTKEVKVLTGKEICEDFANSVCKQYGWQIRGTEWWDLCNQDNRTDVFLIEHARKMIPEALEVYVLPAETPWQEIPNMIKTS